MKQLLLAIPGHLGKDVGATATLDSDGNGSPSFVTKMQEERWINLQQAIGFCLAWGLSDLSSELEVRLVVPKNIGFKMFGDGIIKIHEVDTEVFTLQQRVDLVNSLDADVIEFHNNAAPFVASGFEALVYSRYAESFLIAKQITESVATRLKAKTRSITTIYDEDLNKFTGRKIFLLEKTKNNAIITEGGFMTNKGDLENIDLDLDGFNEQLGASIWLGYQKYILNKKAKEKK